MSLDTLSGVEDKTSKKLAKGTYEPKLELCPNCGSYSLIRCGVITECYSPICDGSDPFEE